MRVFWLGVGFTWLACAVALAAGDLDRVASLVRAGDDRAALHEIDQLPQSARDADSVRYLEGRLLLDVGRPCDAMDKLAQTPASLPTAMRADSLRRWAIAAARCGHCAEARPVLLGLTSSDAAVTRHDRVIAADCAVQLGELDIAAEELERLTRRSQNGADRVALLILLSDVYLRLDRPEEARDTARRGWIAAVRPGQQEAAKQLEGLASPSPSDRVDRAEAFMSARRFSKAIEELEGMDVGDDQDLDERWHHVYGMALFRMRTRYADAARVLRESVALGGEYEIDDAFHAARALSRADQNARAVRAYRRFAQRYPKSSRAPEARFLAAWLEIRMGRASGEPHMERLLKGKHQLRGRWRRSALWELGFRAFERKRYARAVRYLSQYTKLATTSMDEARGLYWLGRSYRRGPKAVEAYREAIGVEPLHWYAVLAAARLKRLKVKPPPPFEKGGATNGSTDVERPLPLPATFEAYHELGLDREGVRWLRDHENELVADYPKAEWIPLLAAMYDDVGAYREGLRVARRRMAYLHTDPEEHPWWWNAAYPMPWLSIVDEHRGELPRALVYATMRQESGYLPDVVSRAGAVGLMQVMPDVAARIAGQPVTRGMLESPEYNIPLGTAEMSALAVEFDGVYPLSIAAYNAGKKRVNRWLRESRRMELDRFVERIPFNETRNYVRRVTTHYARYMYLDDPESGWPKLPRFVKP
ncbi:MAG: transglycosylase SLT domain-containing protein [Deltaproteobacteria bacterium]|nr:transglycosylase SLT domain-containing protein [Deltaproteobacteria bacterium]